MGILYNFLSWHSNHGNTKTDRAFENIFAPGGVIFLRPAAFKKPRWRFAFLCTLLYAFAYDSKKKGSPEAPNFN
jgi:hypothetical protein